MKAMKIKKLRRKKTVIFRKRKERLVVCDEGEHISIIKEDGALGVPLLFIRKDIGKWLKK